MSFKKNLIHGFIGDAAHMPYQTPRSKKARWFYILLPGLTLITISDQVRATNKAQHTRACWLYTHFVASLTPKPFIDEGNSKCWI